MIALDSRGRAVTSLKPSDLELRIDGRVVEIDELVRSDTPLRLAMLFDNSSSVAFVREFEVAAAVKFFRRVIRPDRDMAALFSVADTIGLEQPLTRDVAQIIRSIEAFPPPQGATALLDGIIRAATYLRGTDGRRVIVIVSDGEDTYSDIRTTLEGVVRALQENDCQVYVVNTKEFENFKRTGQRRGNANIRALTAERRMSEIASQTGGAVYSPIDERELEDAFERISSELAQQYIISYYPDDETGNAGESRRIEVTAPKRNDLTIRTRKGYYVAKK
jgi:Ca-activated chloride channel family protein